MIGEMMYAPTIPRSWQVETSGAEPTRDLPPLNPDLVARGATLPPPESYGGIFVYGPTKADKAILAGSEAWVFRGILDGDVDPSLPHYEGLVSDYLRGDTENFAKYDPLPSELLEHASPYIEDPLTAEVLPYVETWALIGDLALKTVERARAQLNIIQEQLQTAEPEELAQLDADIAALPELREQYYADKAVAKEDTIDLGVTATPEVPAHPNMSNVFPIIPGQRSAANQRPNANASITEANGGHFYAQPAARYNRKNRGGLGLLAQLQADILAVAAPAEPVPVPAAEPASTPIRELASAPVEPEPTYSLHDLTRPANQPIRLRQWLGTRDWRALGFRRKAA